MYRSSTSGTWITTGLQVEVYGGFLGHETALVDRGRRYATTILAGDISGTAVYGGDLPNAGNTALRLTDGAVVTLDGFTIRGWQSDVLEIADADFSGRNLFVEHVGRLIRESVPGDRQIELEDVILRDGGIWYVATGGDHRLRNVTFHDGSGFAAVELSEVDTSDHGFCTVEGRRYTLVLGDHVLSHMVHGPGSSWDFLGSVAADWTAAVDNDHVSTGTGNLILASDPFVVAATGQIFLSHTATGQATTSNAVDAGDATAADALGVDWRARTTRLDGVLDTGVPDLGAHYDPGWPVVYDIQYSGGDVSWTEVNSLGCSLDGVPVTSPMPVPSGSFSLLCEGTSGPLWAHFVCSGDPDDGDPDGDGVCG